MRATRTSSLAALLLASGLGACVAQPAQLAGKAPAHKDCVRETGTHIKVKDGDCVNVPGITITREAIESSGGQTVGDALR